MNKLKINKMFFVLAAVISAVSISSCGNKKEPEEEVIYGDIDFDAETVDPVRPKATEKQKDTVGNTYLNLLNGGLFCETEDAWYYVVLYDSEKYLVKQNKDGSDTIKIFQGDIRNIFIYNGWVYGIVNDSTQEYMVVIDTYGNNQYVSERYLNNIRTMQSDGSNIYFTVDQRNVVGMSLYTAILKCDMDLANTMLEKVVSDVKSQVDVIAIMNGNVLFNETCGGDSVNEYIAIENPKETFPVFYNEKVITFDDYFVSETVNEDAKITYINKHNNIAYISATGSSSDYIISYDMDTDTVSYEKYDTKIDGLYEYSEGIVVYSQGKYERIKK